MGAPVGKGAGANIRPELPPAPPQHVPWGPHACGWTPACQERQNFGGWAVSAPPLPAEMQGPAPNTSPHQQPPWGSAQELGEHSAEEARGWGRRWGQGRGAVPRFPEEMSNPSLGCYTSPGEEVALSGDQPRALHNGRPPAPSPPPALWPWPYLGIGKNI